MDWVEEEITGVTSAARDVYETAKQRLNSAIEELGRVIDR